MANPNYSFLPAKGYYDQNTLRLLNHFVNVQDLGALGDGSHDDTAAFLSALDILAGTGVLIVPPGSYVISQLFTIPSSITLLDQGATLLYQNVPQYRYTYYQPSPRTVQLQRDFGASGSLASTTASIAAGSTTAFLADAQDFKNGQGIAIIGAGTVPTNALPNPIVAPYLTIIGTNSQSTIPTGTLYVAYTYVGTNGQTLLSPIASIATVSQDLISIQLPLPFGALGATIYVGTSPTALYAAGTLHIDGTGNNYPYLYVNGYGNSPNAYDPTRCGNGQPVQFVLGSLPPATAPTPPSTNTATIWPTVSATVNGTTGTTTYHYWICPLTWRGGILVPSLPSAVVTNGPSTLSSNNSITLSWSMQNCPAYAVYGAPTNPASSTGLLGITVVPSFTDTGLGVIPAIPPVYPATLPAASQGETLRTRIVQGAGSTALTLADPALTTVTNAPAFHHDTAALQAAYAALIEQNGGEIILEPGTYTLAETVWLDNNLTNNGYFWVHIRLHGSGIQNTVVQALPGTHGPLFASNMTQMAYGYGIAYTEWQDLVLDGQCWYGYDKQPNNYTTFASLVYTLLNTSWFTNVQFQNCYDALYLSGLRLGSSGNISLQGCNVFDAYHAGIVLGGDSNVTVGLVGSNGGNNYSSGSVNYPNHDDLTGGIVLMGSDTSITNVEFYDNVVHVTIFGQENVLSGNLFAGPTTHSIVLGYGASNNAISGNKFQLGINPATSTTYDTIHCIGGVTNTLVAANNWTNSNSGHVPWRYTFYEASGCNANTLASNRWSTAFANASPVNLVGSQSVLLNNDTPLGTVQLPVTLTGTTAGTVTYAMNEQGLIKKFVAYLNSYENTTTTAQTITFPVAFLNPPLIQQSSGLTATVSTTTLTLPASMTAAASGVIVVEGI